MLILFKIITIITDIIIIIIIITVIGAHNNEMINKKNEMFNEIAIFVTNGFEREYEYVLS
jgi:hypothetical protein